MTLAEAISPRQIPIVIYWTTEGFATGIGTMPADGNKTGLLYYGGSFTVPMGDEEAVKRAFQRIMDEEIPAIAAGRKGVKNGTYSGKPIGVTSTLIMGTNDVLITFRVPFRALDS